MSENTLQKSDWEVDNLKGTQRADGVTRVWCRNLSSPRPAARDWAWRSKYELDRKRPSAMSEYWEVDWSQTRPADDDHRRTFVFARNLQSKNKASREWHFVSMQNLVRSGIITNNFRHFEAWEIDWNKRETRYKPSGTVVNYVWARNPFSKKPAAREWHWTNHATLAGSGVKWISAPPPEQSVFDKAGYVMLTRYRMTPPEIAIAEANDLFDLNGRVREHRLRAAQRYGSLSPNILVRHRNGIKSDNRDENLLVGTVAMNNADHHTAHLWLFELYSRYLLLARKYNALRKKLDPKEQLSLFLEEDVDIKLDMESIPEITSSHTRPGERAA